MPVATCRSGQVGLQLNNIFGACFACYFGINTCHISVCNNVSKKITELIKPPYKLGLFFCFLESGSSKVQVFQPSSGLSMVVGQPVGNTERRGW